MKKIISFLFAISSLLILSNLVFAIGSISITSVSIPTSVTQGDSFTITMSISGSTIQNNQATGSLTLPSGLSCTPTGSQTISLSGGGTGSGSWSCSASVAGDYSNRITASVAATDSETAAPLSDPKQIGLTVLSPASITVSSSISSSSVSAGSSVTFTVGVNNAGDSSTTFNITLSCPTGLSCSSTSVGNTAIGGTSLANNQFTITGSTAGSYTITATVNSPAQSGLTTSKSLTVTSTTTTTAAASSGGGGGSLNVTETSKVSTIVAGQTGTINITQSDTLKVQQILLTVNKNVSNVQVTVKEVVQPTTASLVIASDKGTVLKYLEISKTNVNDTDLTKVKIKFKVEKSWLTANNIDSSKVYLYRLTGSTWNKLTTTKLSEDVNYVYYETESPGLSTFAIVGEKSVTPATTQTTTTPQQTTTTTPAPESVGGNTTLILVVGIVLVIVVVAAYFFIKKSSKKQ